VIAELVDRSLILASISATDKDALLTELLTQAAKAGLIAKKEIPALHATLLERERRGSTGIGNGVAVPHVKAKEIKKMGLVVARSQAGVPYDAIDGRPVHTVFLILAPLDQADAHLQALRWISKLARNADFRRFMLQASDDAQMRELLVEMGSAP
jgi:mannitol/fructose-specific phosphotransferase system IIA component (Ntr-type)